jgi:hypothetical protein
MRKSGDGIENIEARQTLLVVLHCSLKLLVRMNSYKSGFWNRAKSLPGVYLQLTNSDGLELRKLRIQSSCNT